MTFRLKLLLIFCILVLSSYLHSFNFFSPIIKQERLNITEEKLIYKLRHDRIIINSEKVFRDTIEFIKSKDFSIDYQKGEISFFKPQGNIIIEYLIYPPELMERFYYYQVQEFSDSTQVKLPPRRTNFFYRDTKLNISGSKTISISFANNEDFSLDQSLFLKIDGELSDNLHIEAQLSDSQSPITPEGDSREISSLDRIFLRLYGKNYELAFGDLEMDFKDTQFMNYSPKFEGLKAGWFSRNRFQGALAISKGKKASFNFKGIEAKQGPYYLSVEESEGVQVIPGSEEVFLNGSKLQRGTDYTIDYSEGSITFTNKYFISSTTFIQVTFQYSDENYRQNMYLASSEVKVTDNFKIRNNIILQNDDKENPLQETFSENDIEVLKNAGDGVAWGNGIFEVEDGLYELSEDETCYYYVGNDTTLTGHYNIHFEDVGFGNGDYEYVEDGDYYEYVGEGEGNYLPIKKLPCPEKKSNYNMILDYQGDFYQINAEGLFSFYDKNSFSGLDENDNDVYAANLVVNLFPDYDKLKPDFKFQYRRIGENISTFADLYNPLDNYELAQLPDTLASEEFSSQVKMDFLNFYQPDIKYQRKIVKNYATQNYFSFTSNMRQKWILPKIYHRYLFWEQNFENDVISFFKNKNLNQHDIKGNYIIKKIKFGSGYFIKELKEEAHDFVKYGERIRKWDFHISTYQTKKLSAEISCREKNNDSLQTSQNWEPVQTSKTIGIKTLITTSKHRTRFNYSHREVTDSTTSKFDMADISSSNSFLKDAVSLILNYSLKNIEFFPKVKEFLYVGENMGSYDVDTVYVGFSEGDYDWEITEIDYDHPEMSVEVNTSFTLYLNPGMISKSFLQKFQTETYLMISENSTEDDKVKVYLLEPGVLMNDETTIYSRNSFQQTLWYDIISRKLTSRLRYKQEKTLDNRYLEESERNVQKDWEATLRLTSLKNVNIELQFENSKEENSRYDSETESNSFVLDIRNRLTNDLTLKSSIQYSKEEGNKSNDSNLYEINSYEILETLTYFFKRKYRLFTKISFKRNERSGSPFLSFLADKKEGNIFKWNLNLDYKVSSFISAKLEYSGNSLPEQDDVHQLSFEVKAEF
ncbi:MAG: hypothetical protein KAW88_08110 [Candidatus Cloacimonetes bacterium]|nr:hypothetical protein [Candidatus Cloacimonadota bacterium]